MFNAFHPVISVLSIVRFVGLNVVIPSPFFPAESLHPVRLIVIVLFEYPPTVNGCPPAPVVVTVTLFRSSLIFPVRVSIQRP